MNLGLSFPGGGQRTHRSSRKIGQASSAATTYVALANLWACCAPRVRERVSRDGNEPPLVACGMQSQFEQSEGPGVSDLTRGQGFSGDSRTSAARAGDKFADTSRRVCISIRVLRGKAF